MRGVCVWVSEEGRGEEGAGVSPAGVYREVSVKKKKP
jgi:hypothetical protein